ncbi:fungal-specific transcription factor domain-containing protein [Trichoderma evansii]
MNSRNPLHLTFPRQNPRLPSRACMECYRRKLKCNRIQSCSNCVRGSIGCIYTNEPIRRDRKSKYRDSKLVDRVAELERLLGSNEGQSLMRNFYTRVEDITDDKSRGFRQHPGRLLIDEPGKSRFLTKTFWTELPAKLEDSYASFGYNSAYQLALIPRENLSGGSFLFPHTVPQVQRAVANPPLDQILRLWKIYVQNVDPLIRVLHNPSIEQILNDLSLNEGSLNSEARTLLLAVCYGAVSSLSPSQARVEFALDTQSYTASFRSAVEKALADAQVLQTHDLQVLQAFVIFLTCIPRKEARSIGVLISLAIQISRTIGLHRDGSVFNLSLFETETRRRIWWHLCSLDWRISEGIGMEATITLSSFDTRMPLNIDDGDMEVASSELSERRDYTEMVFSLIRYEAWKLAASCGNNIIHPYQTPTGIKENEIALNRLSNYLDDTYLHLCRAIPTPISRLVLKVTPLIVAKLRLLILYPACYGDTEEGMPLTPSDKDLLFRSSISLLEFEQSLGADCELSCWRWFFSNAHIQWHAMSFALSELCVRVQG